MHFDYIPKFTYQAKTHKSTKSKEINPRIVSHILDKLIFEERNEYTEIGLSAEKLARRFGTNAKYLTTIINQSKGTSKGMNLY